MSVPFPGFCGPSYQLDNRYAAIERLINWYIVPNESAEEKKFALALDPAPGNAPFSQLPVPAPFNQPNRGLLELRDTTYGVNGNVAFSLDKNGNYGQVGLVVNDRKPVSMAANGNGQVFIASAGLAYVIDTRNGTMANVGVGASFATFQDGYIIVVTPNSNQIQISGSDDVPLGDATKWSAANVSIQAGQADLLRAALSSREYLWLFGRKRSQIYYNVGANGIGGFPFQSYNETFIETGLAAAQSLADMGDSLVWLGEDKRGRRAWQAHAFIPQRISTFAVESQWKKYARVDDAVAFPLIWDGHLMYQITFPSAFVSPYIFPLGAAAVKTPATWAYDVTTSQLLQRPIWFERSYQSALGYGVGRSEQFHCFCYGKHLVGSTGLDGNPGAIYEYSGSQFTDAGTDVNGGQVLGPIVRDRICPHLWQGNKRVIYNRIEFELARGVGLDGGVFGEDPQLLLRWSNDAGNTWTPEQSIPVGKIGQYGLRVCWNRCGYARDRVFWLRATDPVYWGILGAELDTIVCAS